jgi:hypothetical protein
MMHIGRQPFLVEACESVGIERGKSTEAMLWDYLAQFHERRHEEAA